MSFSATDAALEGFRIARERPMTMLIWAAASLLVSLGSSIGMVMLFGGFMNELITMNQTPSGDPAQAIAMMGQLGMFYLFILPVALLIFSVFATAVYRAVLKPGESAFGYLRLGAAELRMAVVMVVLFLLSLVVTFAAVIVVAIVGGVFGAVFSMGGDGGVGGMFLIGALIIVLYIVMIFISLAFWTRFSFAGPMTFVEGRIRIFESWGATKGNFWRLFGCYILAGILGIVVSLLGGAISLALMMALGGGGASGAEGFLALIEGMQADYTTLASFFTPAILANLVVSSLFSALTYAIFLAPPAVAYRDIVGRNSPAVAETFG